MLKEERFEVILKELQAKKVVKFEELAILLDISEDTVRRDIDFLHRNGLLSKARGGAMLREKDPLNFQDRKSFSTKEKDIIALKTQAFIKSGMTIFIDGGTTLMAVVNNMPLDIKLRIITNNLSLIPIVERFKNVEIVVLGGNYDYQLGISHGITTCNEISKYIADLYIMGTCAVDAKFGITAISISDGEAKKIMQKCAKKTIALANDSKLNYTEAFKVSDIQDIKALITNLDSNSLDLDSFRNLGIQIV